jgi:hypothetical protein
LITAYEVYISQLIRYSTACGSYHDFLDKVLLLARKPLNQVFLVVKLKSSFRKFYCLHYDFVNCYGISVSQMTMYHASTSVPFLAQELLTLPEHLSSAPVFRLVRVARSVVFCVMFCRSLFDLFILDIVLSVRLTTSDCLQTFLINKSRTICSVLYSGNFQTFFFVPYFTLS